jgi:hypothetical protein
MLVLSHVGTASAQGPESTAYEDNTAQTPTPRRSFSDQNVFERASFVARERQSRMESQKWQGHIPLRPVYRPLTYSDFSGHSRGPWDRYYGYQAFYGPIRAW